MIEYIKTDKLWAHPNNPRKDLGDLTELAESIKANGILQNLTVVEKEVGFCRDCKIYNGGLGKCKEDHDKTERPPCQYWDGEISYTVVIGHRRLAAAKLAGLEEVPCVIADMDERTQVATMLLENIQRSDLTVYEQAQGFQMMMNFGETVQGIADKTGFSTTTVRKRTKLLELDQEKFRKSVEKGATLMDFAELEKIQDSELRNKVLEKFGTSNYRWELQNALARELAEKNKAEIRAVLETFATELKEYDYNIYYAAQYYNFFQSKKVEVPEDADTVEYFFKEGSSCSYLLKKREKTNPVERELTEEEKRENERRAALDEMTKRAYSLRQDFIKGFTGFKNHLNTVIAYLIKLMIEEHVSASNYRMAKLLNIVDEKGSWHDDDLAKACEEEMPEKIMLYAVYSYFDGGDGYKDWKSDYRPDEELDMLYDFLVELGYTMSDDEKALRDGTHELFKKAAVEGKDV